METWWQRGRERAEIYGDGQIGKEIGRGEQNHEISKHIELDRKREREREREREIERDREREGERERER